MRAAVTIRGGTRRTGGVELLAVGVVLLLLLRQAYIVPFTGLGQSPAQMIFSACAAIWLITRLVGRPGTRGVRPLRIAMSLVVVSELASYVIAMRSPVPYGQIWAADRALSTSLIYLAITLFVLEAVRDWRDVELIVKCAVGGGAVSGLMALVQSLTDVDLATTLKPPGLRVLDIIRASRLREGLVRPQGTASHPLELAAVMTVLIPVALGLVGSLIRRREPAWPWIIATGLLTAGAAVSLSRLALIGTSLAILLVVTRWPARRLSWVAITVAGVIEFQVLVGSKTISVLTRLITKGSDDYSLASRSDARSWVFEHLPSFFFFGTGPGTAAPDEPVLDNEYLARLVHSGIIGLAAFLVLIGTVSVLALRATWATANRANGELAVGIAGGLLAMVLCYAVLDVEAFVQISFLAAILAGLGARCAVLAATGASAAADLLVLSGSGVRNTN